MRRADPFGGEYTVFAGLAEAVRTLRAFRFTEEHIDFLRSGPNMAHADPAFWEWLGAVDCSRLRMRALAEGTIAFPRTPLLILEGPLAIAQASAATQRRSSTSGSRRGSVGSVGSCSPSLARDRPRQMLETSLLNAVNYPSLVATNAARFRVAAGPSAKLFELGLRRAQARYARDARETRATFIELGLRRRAPTAG